MYFLIKDGVIMDTYQSGYEFYASACSLWAIDNKCILCNTNRVVVSRKLLFKLEHPKCPTNKSWASRILGLPNISIRYKVKYAHRTNMIMSDYNKGVSKVGMPYKTVYGKNIYRLDG